MSCFKHNAVTPARLQPATPRSRVKHSTTESLHSLYTECHVSVVVHCLFLMVPWVGLESVIVAFYGHTHYLNLSCSQVILGRK